MIKTDKILSPILWLCGISTPFFLTGAYAFRNVPTIFPILIITAIVPIGIACIIIFSTILLLSKDDQHPNLQPVLWLCGISTLFFLAGAYAFRDVPKIFLILIITALVPIGIACIFFLFTTFSPKKLLPKDDQDRHNNTINKPPNPNLQPGIETLIEMHISEAADRLHDLNQSDLKELNLKHTKPWQVWSISATVLITASGIISWLVAPDWIRKIAEDYIQKKFIDEPFKLIVSDEMKKYIKTEFAPLKAQLKIQQLASASQAGLYDKYEELTKLDLEKPPYSEYAEDINTAITDINFYYDALKYQISGSVLGTGYISVDEIIGIYRKSVPKRHMREAAIGTLINQFMKHYGTIKENIVQELCESVDSELNLRVIARTTLLLQYLTNTHFTPINKDAVRSWWEDNKKEPKYQSPYTGYLKALDRIDQGFSTDNDKKNEIISFLKETIDADPNALHAKCLLGGFLALTGDYLNANKEFDEVEKINAGYRWLFFWRAVSYIQQDKTKDAIDALNKSFTICPERELEDYARKLADNIPKFKDLIENQQIKWPSKIIEK